MKATDYKTEEQASNYANYRFKKGLSIVSHDELNLIDKWLSNLESKDRSVDLGSGTGRALTVLLKHSTKTVTAVDQSEVMLGELRKKFAKELENKKLQIIQNNSDNTLLKANTINIVTALHLIKHLPNPQPTFKEAARILDKGGVFIFDALNNSSLVRLNMGTCVATDEKSLIRQLEQNGMQILDYTYLHPLGETIYNLPAILLPFVKLVDGLISFLLPRSGTKIFILAVKK